MPSTNVELPEHVDRRAPSRRSSRSVHRDDRGASSPRSSQRTGRRDDRGAPSPRSSRRPGYDDRRDDRGAPSPRSSRRSEHKDDRSRSPPRNRALHDPYESPREVRGVRGLQLLAKHGSSPGDTARNQDAFADQVRGRVQADIAGLRVENFTVDSKHKFKAKITPSNWRAFTGQSQQLLRRCTTSTSVSLIRPFTEFLIADAVHGRH